MCPDIEITRWQADYFKVEVTQQFNCFHYVSDIVRIVAISNYVRQPYRRSINP